MTHLLTPKETARAFYAGYNDRDLAANFDQYVAPDVAVHALQMDLSRAAWLEADASLEVAFKDASMTILDQVAEGEKVATRWIFTGTQRAEFFGVPSNGNTSSLSGTSVDVIRGGKIVEHWTELDLNGFLQRLTAQDQTAVILGINDEGQA